MAGRLSSLVMGPCRPEELEAALAVLYRRARPRDRSLLVAEGMAEVARGDLDPSGLWVAHRWDRLIGALLTQPLAGRAAAVWPPEVALKLGRSKVAVALVRAVLDGLRQRGALIAQSLVDMSSPRHAAADLTRGGLARITDLIYLSRETAAALPVPDGSSRFRWRPYDESTEPEFAEVLSETYRDSLDMPELEGARSLQDVLASHRAGGRFDPTRWQLGRLDGEPRAAAVVLLSDLPERGVWEVAYLGLTPQARGRGLGRAALAHALGLARPHAPRVELAVDVRNLPAERLYRGAGFRQVDRRSVHLAVLNAGGREYVDPVTQRDGSG
jgi:ribosomal protein S18 acetylase RimI-like enzyme